jgi:hypothetical protein
MVAKLTKPKIVPTAGIELVNDEVPASPPERTLQRLQFAE